MLKNTSKKPSQKARNFVAKHANTYNRASFHADKKAAFKRGKMKHQKQESYLMHFILKFIR